jgi:glyoxylase-like metal-dependent hydrolase (beta-lactamase superfamily II)
LVQEKVTSADPADLAKILTVAPGFRVRQAIDNIAWIDLGEYAIVVDALEQPELEEEVFAAIRTALGDKPVRYLINTHTHYDHVALNEAFHRRCGAKIINAQTASIPSDGTWFEGSKRRVRVLPMPGCHTEEDLVVWVEPDRALFVGDIFGWGLIPLVVNLRADTAGLLATTYTRLIEFGPSVVIPGHGPLCAATELKRWLEYFRWLQREIAGACARGQDDKEILHGIAPPEDMKTWWRFLKWKHQDSVAKVLKAVRKGRL